MFLAAVFDMDGLLLDSERTIMQAWMASAQDMGITLPMADYLSIVGRSSKTAEHSLTALLGGKENFHRARVQVHGRLRALGADAFALKPGAFALLSRLAQLRIPCAVASSTAVEEVRRRLDAVDALGFFAAVAGGNEVDEGKPAPDVYWLAARRLGYEPSECIAFEDSENGAKAAVSAGIAVVVVPDLVPVSCRDALAVLPSLGHAQALLPSWFNEQQVRQR